MELFAAVVLLFLLLIVLNIKFAELLQYSTYNPQSYQSYRKQVGQ